MKPAQLLMLVSIVWFTPSVKAQTQDTTANRHRQERTITPQGSFRDENGNGIDDRVERRRQGQDSRKDRFVDADGDGICDGRVGGLGFRRGAGAGGTGTAGSSVGKGSGTGKRFGQGGKK